MNGRTLFDEVQLLNPGHHRIIDLQKVAVVQDEPYWFSTLNESKESFPTALERVKKSFERSVKRHLLSDVPVAATLSSGFDSASVAAQAAQLIGQGLDTYTGVFNQSGSWYDETNAAADLTKSINGTHHIVNIQADDFLKHFDDMIYALDEPRLGMGTFPQYMVARQAAKNFKVILTGHGGDELFSGYPVFKLARKGGWRSVSGSEIPHLIYFALSKMKSFLSAEYGRHMPVLWNRSAREKLFGRIDKVKSWSFLSELQDKYSTPINQVFQTYLKVYLPNLLLVEDKISMAHAIESRTPMPDNEMISLSLSISQDIKLHQGKLKALIKGVAKTLLPKSYHKQPKRGFPIPLRQWLRGPLSGIVNDRLLSEETPLHRIMDKDGLRKWVANYQTSWKRNFRPLDEIQSHQIWQLLSLESWLRVWEDRNGVHLK